MEDDMDIDIDLEEEDPEIAQLKAQAQAISERAQAAQAESEVMNVVEEAEDGELRGLYPITEKLHIRGLDNLTTANIRAYVKEHHTDETFKRVEWIDDTSANLIFSSSEAASEALTALSAEESPEALEVRAAKQMTTHPDVQLQIRQAVAADVKLPGAKDRSRFYLMNPEYDPDNRATHRKRRYEDERNGSYKRRRNDNRRTSSDSPAFDVNLYDDDTPVRDASVERKRTQMQDLFANRKTERSTPISKKNDGRLRDRSASPVRDGDGRYGFDETEPHRRAARQRSATPPHLRKARRREYGEEDGKYLPRHHDRRTDTSRAKTIKELFPDKNGAHKRSDAQDLHADHVADIFVPKSKPKKGDLFDRITTGKEHGRLNDTDGDVREGFSILGAAKDRPENPLVKELFLSRLLVPRRIF
ncbi:hypothetical protein AMS68_003787 [Peltaster fructicola]|uniref:Uncharacterized protein n=1 Tax=Peltaster fructicola TaxID=286661 RepID=A0A6H0XUZ5_9PEZI|nr:hypothetical protein AMS68_003787 [Peltaster fructicola]